MAVQSAMPHQLLGYELDDVEGVLLSLTIISAVSKKQEHEMKNPPNKAKANPRRDRMKNKTNPKYLD